MADSNAQKAMNEAISKLLAESGWAGTFQEFVAAWQADFSEDLCNWLYGLGNSHRQKRNAPPPEEQRVEIQEWIEDEYAKMQAEYPDYAKQAPSKAKIQRYVDECYMPGYEGKELETESGSGWMWWLLVLAGLGVGGYYITKSK